MEPIDSATLEALRRAAFEAAARAWAPYSQFFVGAALLFDDGRVVTGCNVENMSYGLTVCAERNALGRAVSEQGPAPRIRAIAVANRNGAASPPCGACRQVLSEFVAPGALVTFPGEQGPETRPFADILPFSFRFEPGSR